MVYAATQKWNERKGEEGQRGLPKFRGRKHFMPAYGGRAALSNQGTRTRPSTSCKEIEKAKRRKGIEKVEAGRYRSSANMAWVVDGSAQSCMCSL